MDEKSRYEQFNEIAFEAYCKAAIENHRQGFSTALSMPEYTAFTVCLGSVLGRCNRLFHSKILVIPGKDFEGVLSVYIKTDKIFQDVQKAFFFKQSFKKGIKLCVLGVLIAAILSLPFHVAILAGGDCPSLGGSHIAHDADGVIDEE